MQARCYSFSHCLPSMVHWDGNHQELVWLQVYPTQRLVLIVSFHITMTRFQLTATLPFRKCPSFRLDFFLWDE